MAAPDDDFSDSKPPARPATESLSRMSSISTATVSSGGHTWFKSLDWMFRSNDSGTGILRDEFFKNDVSYDIAFVEAATASGANSIVAAFPPPLPLSRNQSTNITASQDSWLRKMWNPCQDKGTTAVAMALPPLAGQLVRSKSTGSQSSSLLQQTMYMYNASKYKYAFGARMWESQDWATDLTVSESLNVADVFKTSNEKKKMFLAQQQQNEYLAEALENAQPPTAGLARVTAETMCRTVAAAPANHHADFMQDMMASCTPATSTTADTTMPPSPLPLSGTESEAETTASGTCSISSSTLKNPSAGTSSKKKRSRKRKQPDKESNFIQGPTTLIHRLPTDKDVLCGRGPEANRHNIHFIDMCKARADEYCATNKRGNADGAKLAMVMEIIKAIHDNGGRFIGKDKVTHQWQVLSEQAAIDKTSHCIRDIVNKRNKKHKIEQQQQQQQQQEPTA